MTDKADPLELPFDQYQRYRLVADLLGELRAGGQPLKVLDVGGRTALLRRFLSDDVTLVDVERSEEPGLVLGDGGGLPFRDGSFDAVTAFDTLEHVPPEARERFVDECARVARKWVVLAGPYEAPRVVEAEEALKRFMKEKLGIEHRYLNEHRGHGLPVRAAIEGRFEKLGAQVESFGHANLDRWLVLMCLSMYMDDDPALRGLAQTFHRFYNSSLYHSDHAAPVYRHLIVAAFDGAPLPDASKFLAPPVAPKDSLSPFVELEVELLAFDRERREWRAERQRLRRVSRDLERDLAGHRVSLGVARADTTEATKVAQTLVTDVEGHRRALATAEEDLIGHRTSLREAHVELKARANVIHELTSELETERRVGEDARAALAKDLSAHRRTIEQLQVELGNAQTGVERLEGELTRVRTEERRVRETLERDLLGHRHSIAEREKELEAHRGEAAALRAELEEHRAATEVLREDLEGHRAATEALREDLEGHRAVRVEHEGELAAGRQVVAALERSLGETREVRDALERDLAEHRETLAATRVVVDEKAAGIEHLEGELRRLEGVAGELQADLARSNENAAGLAGELERSRDESEQRGRALEVQNEELGAVRTELEQRAAILSEREAEIRRLEAEVGRMGAALRDRWGNLKRAVSFRPPAE